MRILPAGLVKGFCVIVAEFYFLFRRQRREVVVQNFLPVFAGDRAAAERAAHRLHRNFAVKLVDLWRVESGVPVQDWLTNSGELEIIRTARATRARRPFHHAPPRQLGAWRLVAEPAGHPA